MLALAHLIFETLTLVDGVVQFGKGVATFQAANEWLETFYQTRYLAMILCQGRDVARVVGQEDGLAQQGSILAEYGSHEIIDQAAAPMLRVYLVSLSAHLRGQTLFVREESDINPRKFRDGIQQGNTRPGRSEIYFTALVGDTRRPPHFDSNVVDHFLNQCHHIFIISIGLVAFHHGKFRVMYAVNTFITEIAPNFIYFLETTYDQAL